MERVTFEDAMGTPGDVFTRPDDVLESAFTMDQQRRILENWEDQLQKRQLATAEGMAGTAVGAEQTLAAIAAVLQRLDAQLD